MKSIAVILAVLLGGCVSVPESWTQPIVPKVSASHEVEYPWEALAVRNVDGKFIRVQIPEEWYRWQFPYVPVREPESKEVIPLQRITSRVVLFCGGQRIRSSAVVTGNHYDVLVPAPCRDSDRGVILSGSGKHVLTFEGKMALDVDVGKLMNDMKYQTEFFVSYPFVVHRPQSERLPVEVTRLFNQIALIDRVRYRIGYESQLAMVITVGKSFDERFLACGGGDVNVVGTVMYPQFAAVRPLIASVCAAAGEPTGLFVPDGEFFNATPTRSEP